MNLSNLGRKSEEGMWCRLRSFSAVILGNDETLLSCFFLLLMNNNVIDPPPLKSGINKRERKKRYNDGLVLTPFSLFVEK